MKSYPRVYFNIENGSAILVDQYGDQFGLPPGNANVYVRGAKLRSGDDVECEAEVVIKCPVTLRGSAEQRRRLARQIDATGELQLRERG